MCEVCFPTVLSFKPLTRGPHSVQNKKWNISKTATLISKASVWQRHQCFPQKCLMGLKEKAVIIIHKHFNSLLARWVIMCTWCKRMLISLLINYWTLIEAFARRWYFWLIMCTFSLWKWKALNWKVAAGIRVSTRGQSDRRLRLDLNFSEFFITAYF